MIRNIYKGYKIEISEKWIVLKIISGEGGWILEFPELNVDLMTHTKKHIDNCFLPQDQKAGRI
jgi:hypothetical protein|tara:strand:- start:533 stop:721 length:189 start_codon:yes stop_codon:yes gene_type:complete